MLKKVVSVGVGVVLIALAGGVAWYLFSNLDSIVKAAISGLTVANPKGFSSLHALDLGSIAVTLDTSSVTGSGPIVIKEIDVERPHVTYEVDNGGTSNLATIQKNAANYAGGSSSGAQQSQSGRKLVIDDLVVRQGEVGISASAVKGNAVTVPLPEIHLTNIGKSSGGATPGQVAGQVLAAISGAAAKVGSSELAKSIGAAVSNAGSALGGATQGVGSQIKGLFGK